jgi:hypothetical protein
MGTALADGQAPPNRPEMSLPDLATRILVAEQAVATRDRRVQQRSGALVARLEADVTRGLGVAALALPVLALLLARRGGGSRVARQAAVGPADGARLREAAPSWLALAAAALPLVWPYVPASWRRVLSASGASALVAAVAPFIEGLLRTWRRRR